MKPLNINNSGSPTEQKIEPPEVMLFSEEAYVGVIRSTKLASLTVHLSEKAFRDGVVRVGRMVVAKGHPRVVLGMVSSLDMTEGGGFASVELIGTYDVNSGEVSSGVEVAPSVGLPVFLAPDALVQSVTGYRGIETGEVALKMARLPHNPDVQLSFAPERLFGRHLAILGTSGSGKSWTTARLINECARFRSKVILFDATGEYHTLDAGVTHVHLGDDPEKPKFARAVALPYYDLIELDLFAIFQPQGQSQAAKLRAAIESLKLARLVPGLASDGTIHKAFKSKVEFLRSLQAHSRDLEDPRALFDIRGLVSQIRNECVETQQSQTEPMYWGGHNSIDYSHCVPLINRIQDIIGSPSLETIFNPGGRPSLFDELLKFLRDPSQKVLRVSLKYLSFAHNARQIVANAIGRYLMDAARLGVFRKMPLLIVVDEAHQFLNNVVIAGEQQFPLDAFGLIAKEGRKYSLSVCLVTQRPRDIPEDVLSQMGTMIVHRLINHNDLGVVERASGEMDRGMASSIPVLKSGEGILVGVDFPVPLRIRVEVPTSAPDSKGPNYQEWWSGSGT